MRYVVINIKTSRIVAIYADFDEASKYCTDRPLYTVVPMNKLYAAPEVGTAYTA